MKGLYKFYWDYYRAGKVFGIFVADEEDVRNLIGRMVDFGEILGKHSDVSDIVEEKDITLLTNDEKVIAMYNEYIGDIGYNPLDAIVDEE